MLENFAFADKVASHTPYTVMKRLAQARLPPSATAQVNRPPSTEPRPSTLGLRRLLTVAEHLHAGRGDECEHLGSMHAVRLSGGRDRWRRQQRRASQSDSECEPPPGRVDRHGGTSNPSLGGLGGGRSCEHMATGRPASRRASPTQAALGIPGARHC